ncbi:MAG TPA: hypothetical protein EYG73_10690 [Arcobacter sp.]|nr:hypothetical protein [Arcobacter sp.]
MKILYTFILLTTLALQAEIKITSELKQKAQSMLKEITVTKKAKLTPKEFIAASLFSTGLERYSVSTYISKDFSDGQAVFDEPYFYKKECFNPKKYVETNVELSEKKVQGFFYPVYSKYENYKCQYNTKSISEIKKLDAIFYNHKLHNELVSLDYIGILPILFDRDIPLKTLISTQYQYENVVVEFLEYPPSSLQFKKNYNKLWK